MNISAPPPPRSRPPPGEMGPRGRHCVPSSRRCNLPRSPRNPIAPQPANAAGPDYLYIIPSQSRARGSDLSLSPTIKHPPGRYPQHRYLFGVSPLRGPQPGSVPAEGTAGWGVARGGGRGDPGPVPAAGTASDAPRHKGGDSLSSQRTAYRQDNNNDKRHIWLK